MLEKNIDDHWKVYGDRELSDTWTGFTSSATLKETQKWVYVVRVETDEKANDLQAG